MDPKTARERLEKEKERLRSIAHNLAEDHDLDETNADERPEGELSSLDQHPADTGSETFEREKDMAILNGLEDQLSEVDEALKRVEDGSYGVCEACGKEIGAERLEVVPTARYCVEDQGAREA